MSLQIRHAREEDVPAIAILTPAAYSESASFAARFPDHLRTQPGLKDLEGWTDTRTRKGLADPNQHHIVAVETDAEGRDTIVGCAEWHAPKPEPGPSGKVAEETPQKTPEEEAKAKAERLAALPSFIDKVAVQRGNDETDALIKSSEAVFEGKSRSNMWTLNSLVVSKAHRGKGIGKTLARWGVEQAEKSEQDVWLIASADGRYVYQSLGFKEIATDLRFGAPEYLFTKFFEPRQ